MREGWHIKEKCSPFVVLNLHKALDKHYAGCEEATGIVNRSDVEWQANHVSAFCGSDHQVFL